MHTSTTPADPYYTDYPLYFCDGNTAPIREVELLGWDGNKYCVIRDPANGSCHSIKLGYVYTEPGRCGEAPHVKPSTVKRINVWEFMDAYNNDTH
jgi:hypothetical protein